MFKNTVIQVYTRKCAHIFVVFCFVAAGLTFLLDSSYALAMFLIIASLAPRIVRSPQRQWSDPESLRWRHNDHAGVSNHQPYGCFLNRLFGRRWKKTSKLRVTGLCVGNSPGPVNSPHKGTVTRKMFPFDDVIMRSQAAGILFGCTVQLLPRMGYFTILFSVIRAVNNGGDVYSTRFPMLFLCFYTSDCLGS